MKVVLAIVVLIVFALSFVADYRWRRWMAKRRAERDDSARRDRV
jgi:hypothetical protein